MRHLAVGAFLFLAIGVYAAPRVQPAQPAPYVNRIYGFSFRPPASWVPSANPDAAVVFLEPGDPVAAMNRPIRESNAQFIARVNRSLKQPLSTERGFRANITVVAAQIGDTTVEEYARVTRVKAAKMHSYRILREVPRKLGGLPAVERTVRVNAPNGTRVQTREVFAIRNGRLLTITLASAPASFWKHSAEFDKVLTSFAWK